MYSISAICLSLVIILGSRVNAASLPLTRRGLFPEWSCPGPNEGQSNYDIPTADMQALAMAIKENSLTSGIMEDSILIKASHGIVITAGSVQVCIENKYWFENAHYARNDIALVVADSIDKCCGGQDNLAEVCNARPWNTIRGDTGLKAIATIGRAGDECQGAPTGQDYLDAGQFAFKTGKFFWDVFSPLITGSP